MRFLLPIALLCACGPSSPKKKAPLERPKAVPLESSVQAGSYALTGRTLTDHCEESLVLAAKEISINLEAQTLTADLVERAYALEVRGDELVATGRFEPLEECGTHKFIEVWRLRPQGPETLQGQLTTYYRDSSDDDCLRACKFVTEIKAERTTKSAATK